MMIKDKKPFWVLIGLLVLIVCIAPVEATTYYIVYGGSLSPAGETDFSIGHEVCGEETCLSTPVYDLPQYCGTSPFVNGTPGYTGDEGYWYGNTYICLAATGGSAPVSEFSGSPTSGAAPLTVTFSDSSTNTPTSWLWDFHDGSTTNNTSQNPVHTFTSAGTYDVGLQATNAYGSDWENKTEYISVSSVTPTPTTAIPTPTPTPALPEGATHLWEVAFETSGPGTFIVPANVTYLKKVLVVGPGSAGSHGDTSISGGAAYVAGSAPGGEAGEVNETTWISVSPGDVFTYDVGEGGYVDEEGTTFPPQNASSVYKGTDLIGFAAAGGTPADTLTQYGGPYPLASILYARYSAAAVVSETGPYGTVPLANLLGQNGENGFCKDEGCGRYSGGSVGGTIGSVGLSWGGCLPETELMLKPGTGGIGYGAGGGAGGAGLSKVLSDWAYSGAYPANGQDIYWDGVGYICVYPTVSEWSTVGGASSSAGRGGDGADGLVMFSYYDKIPQPIPAGNETSVTYFYPVTITDATTGNAIADSWLHVAATPPGTVWYNRSATTGKFNITGSGPSGITPLEDGDTLILEGNATGYITNGFALGVDDDSNGILQIVPLLPNAYVPKTGEFTALVSVYDADTTAALSGVSLTLSLNGISSTKTTASSGTAAFKNLTAGDAYSLVVIKTGYTSLTKSVTGGSGAVVTVDVPMSAVSVNPTVTTTAGTTTSIVSNESAETAEMNEKAGQGILNFLEFFLACGGLVGVLLFLKFCKESLK